MTGYSFNKGNKLLVWSQMTSFPCTGRDHCNIYFLFQVDFPNSLSDKTVIVTHSRLLMQKAPLFSLIKLSSTHISWSLQLLCEMYVLFPLSHGVETLLLNRIPVLKMDILPNTDSHWYLWKISKEILQSSLKATLQKIAGSSFEF